MGKKNKDKKKGKGAEKTAAKTEKKLSNKFKKQLEALGEDDIEHIVAEIEKEEKEKSKVVEVPVEPPSRRVNSTFIAHPDKEELILYGGEYFDGQKTFLYNDLFFYNIPNNTWILTKSPAGPPPRCGHQMVATSANKGQLWIFGGEYASPSQSQFYHYRDLWVYHLATKQWEKINATNGPTARSGHRMVLHKKQLIVFGGFHDNLREYKYFNDVYSFNTENYEWTKLNISGSHPTPRSGCAMVCLTDGRILVYGGYSKERIKKEVDKGHVYSDAYLLTLDKNDTTGLKWKWVSIKLGSTYFSPRCGMPIVSTPNNLTAYCYGGVHDEEDDEENMCSNFYNDFLALDLGKLAWKNISLVGLKDKTAKSRRKIDKDECEDDDERDDEMEIQDLKESVDSTTIADDGIFKVTVGPSISNLNQTVIVENKEIKLFQPSPRMNCGLAIKHSYLYLYGGMFEDGNKQITFRDFYALDLKKLDQWKTLVSDDISNLEWMGSESESEDDEGSDSEESSDSDMDES